MSEDCHDNDYPTQEQLDAWANCLVPDCENKCCLRLNSDLCYPHTMELRRMELK